ncbi:hypothetical protein [Uliginosibacterium sediminicola]|uniref:Tfp pilus assembly protein PilN n=1 Tax=Uliginosibacterium sediminicola TaxID=2024550 RepID=A0ABU9YV43_9RHOO
MLGAEQFVHLISHAGLRSFRLRGKQLEAIAEFNEQPAEQARFSQFVETHARARHSLLFETPEQIFQDEKLPPSRGADRRALIARRLTRHFPVADNASPARFCLALPQGRSRSVFSRKAEEEILLTGLSSKAGATLETWLASLRQARAPVRGVWSSALLCSALRMLICKQATRGLILLLTAQGIRQIYFDHGQLRFSRLAAAPDSPLKHWAPECVREAQQMRLYLGNRGWLAHDEVLDVFVPLPEADIAAFDQTSTQLLAADGKLRFHWRRSEEMCAQLGLRPTAAESAVQECLLKLTLRSRAPQLAAAPDLRADRHQHAFQYSVVLSLVLLLGSASLAGLWYAQALALAPQVAQARTETQRLAAQTQQVQTAQKNTPEHLAALRSALQGLDEASQQRLDPRGPLLALSQVLDDFKDVQLTQLRWQDSRWPEAAIATDRPRHILQLTAKLLSAADTAPASSAERIRSFSRSLQSALDGELIKLELPLDDTPARALHSDELVATQAAHFSVQIKLGNTVS